MKLSKNFVKDYVDIDVDIKTLAENTKSGTTVLLSPACTSFDEFKSYEDRGVKFKEYVLEYTK